MTIILKSNKCLGTNKHTRIHDSHHDLVDIFDHTLTLCDKKKGNPCKMTHGIISNISDVCAFWCHIAKKECVRCVFSLHILLVENRFGLSFCAFDAPTNTINS